jgi:hypothetical protein
MSQGNGASGPHGRIEWTAEEEVEFAALFSIAWALKGTDAYRAALETIADWHADLLWRRAQRQVAHRAAETDRLVQVLRDTDPDRIAGSVTA